MIKTISLDIETYSSVDISKSGVYRYAESDDFEILLLSYSLDGGEIHTIDLAMGERIPEEVLLALVSETVEHWAYNSSFERICLSSWLRKNRPDLFKGYGREDESTTLYLSPASWYCDMVLSAYSGLPLSLKGVGTVLKLDEQKDEKGKPLIKFFCTPSYNGEQHYYYHDIIRWEEFKDYNAQDVRTEMAIHQRLNTKYPVPQSVWEEYHVSETINDRGIAVDMDLVRSAIALDKVSREDLTQKLSSLTMLDNPNSVSQMKSWLKENGIEAETLGKKAVEALLKNEDMSPEIKQSLSLRLQLAKSSIRKYDAIESCVCRDGRVHGMFMFYGANRTGRWCLTGDHEVLTKRGWVRLDEWKGGSIACWNARNEIVSFQKANAVSFDYTGPMYTYKDCRIDQCSTPDHKMRAKRRCDKPWDDMTVADMATCRPMIPLTGYKDYRCCADPAWLRVLIMTQADGFYTEDGTVRYHFKKIRKVERCKMLLRKAGIYFTENSFKNGCTAIAVPARCVPLWLRQFTDKTFGYWLFDENPDIFFDELPYWDGYYPTPNSIQYSTINKTNADLVQALAHLSGRTAVVRKKNVSEKHPNWNDSYIVDIWQNATNAHEIRTKPEITVFSGKVYCAETTTGYFLVRRNGKVWVTGNSGRIVQLQNLRQNHIEDLENAREIVKTGDSNLVTALYDDVPDTLSQLIRTAFIPKEGYKFIVADYSAIEARVIAYLAKEQWRINAFARGDDIYCAAASQMFKVPVVKHGINGELRQRGKVAELACGYGGGVGALKAMGALDMGLKEEDLKPLVDSWRAANSNIVQFWKDTGDAVMEAIRERTQTETHGLLFEYKSGVLFITLPSGRHLSYVKPRIELNQYGTESVTYEGIGATKKWERMESYGPKFVENIVQAISRDILCSAMIRLQKAGIATVAHVHDETINEVPINMTVDDVAEIMSISPEWMKDINLTAAGYECSFYMKD